VTQLGTEPEMLEAPLAADEILIVKKTGEIEEVTLNRPERLNALNQPLTDALLGYFTAKKRDASTRVILVSGTGRAFCSGADLKAAGQPDRLQDGPNGDWVLRDLLKTMRACPQPIIALVHGAAAGGGLAIALAADVIIAGESAVFHPAFIKIGLSGSELGVSWRLQRTIGLSRAREMLLTGRPMNATDSLRCGLVSAITPDSELHAHGHGLAEDMLKAAPDALRVSKRTFDATLEIGSYDAALELEERGQIQMIRAGRARQNSLPK
jgi:enoyl-CoA hydratase/carnithine racemase